MNSEKKLLLWIWLGPWITTIANTHRCSKSTFPHFATKVPHSVVLLFFLSCRREEVGIIKKKRLPELEKKLLAAISAYEEKFDKIFRVHGHALKDQILFDQEEDSKEDIEKKIQKQQQTEQKKEERRQSDMHLVKPIAKVTLDARAKQQIKAVAQRLPAYTASPAEGRGICSFVLTH